MYDDPLRYAVIEVTNRCNQRCRHCASSSGHARASELSLSEWHGVFQELRGLGCQEITLIGGELLLHPNWPELCEAVKETGARLAVVTNGTLLKHESQFQSLLRVAPQVVGVSLDGANRESYALRRGTDSFDEVWAALGRLRAARTRQVTAITAFSRSNVRDFDAFVELLRDTGVVWQIQFVHQGGQRLDAEDCLSPQEYRALAQRIAEARGRWEGRLRILTMDDFGYYAMSEELRDGTVFGGCQGGISILGIRSNGDVLPCLSLGDAFVAGNLRQRGLTELWRDDSQFAEFRHKAERLSGHCAECPVARTCRAGCTALAVSGSGHFGENPYCLRHAETVELITDLLPDTTAE